MTHWPGDMTTANQIEVGELSGEHIGKLIRFIVMEGDPAHRQTECVVTAELRQIYHHGGATVLNTGYGAVEPLLRVNSERQMLRPSV